MASACLLLVAGAAYVALRLAVAVAPLTLAVVAALLITALLEPLTAVLVRLRLPDRSPPFSRCWPCRRRWPVQACCCGG